MHPGGGGCWDFDAAHTLIMLDIDDDNVNTRIMDSLIRLKNSLLNSINSDGGFVNQECCQIDGRIYHHSKIYCN